MPDVFADGNTRVAYCPAISNIASPTTTELNAGILLHSVMTPDGLQGFEPETADVPTDALDSLYDTVGIGRDSVSGSLMLKKQTSGDVAFTTLVRSVQGYIVIRRDISAATGWASGQKVEVFPVVFGTRKRKAPEKNSVAKYEVPAKIWQQPNIDATIA